jgi:hypothetical protein
MVSAAACHRGPCRQSKKILLDSIDTWLFTQPSLVNSRKRSVIPVVLQRQALKALLKRVGSQEFQRLLGQT